jgi:hypothetical protein
VATGIGLFAGTIVGQASGRAVSAALGEPIQDDMVAGRPLGLISFLAVAGAVIGVAQWLVLRRRLVAAGWWVPTTIAGAVALPLLAALQVPDLPRVGPPGIGRWSSVADGIGFITDGAIRGAIIGTLVGLAQRPVLRRLPRAGWWVPASTAAWAVQQAADEAALVLGDMGLLAPNGTGVLLIEILLASVRLGGAGAITGLALLWLLRRAQRMACSEP